MDRIKVLVIDDEPEISGLVRKYMKVEGYEADIASTGEEGLRYFNANDYQLIIADIMMPGIDGYELCEKIRKSSDVPIIFISARNEEVDKLLGFKSGADDYLTKPFSINELMARCRVTLKRYLNSNSSPSPVIKAGSLTINTDSYKVTKNGTPVSLRAKEFEILTLLVKNRGKVFSRQAIFYSIWEEDGMENDENTVTVHMRRIREKIEDKPDKPELLKTVWGIGYKFAEEDEEA